MGEDALARSNPHREFNETEIRSKFITPALKKAGWEDLVQIRHELRLTEGPVRVRGRIAGRGKHKQADYVLFMRPGIPLAVVEAKDNKHQPGDGMQQALAYAEMLDVPFAFSSNGKGFVFHDATSTQGHDGNGGEMEYELPLGSFPSPAALWQKFVVWKGYTPEQEKLILQEYYQDATPKEPRYYQLKAVNRTVEAVARGQDRVLLVMATGTGKTYTAFQIIWRLWKAGRVGRTLFLADRNILVDQTMVNDFRPFGGVMAKLSTSAKTIERDDGNKIDLPTVDPKARRVDPAFEVYLGLYQALTGPDERKKVFKHFKPTFFDLIVVDECHRGSAAEDSAWREILEYFSGAVQVGLTATPKETEYISNITYFGEPIYTYSLKDGIADGYLAPYKVIKVHIDRDVQGYRPSRGDVDRDGHAIEDRIYNQKDFDRSLVLTERTKLVAAKISEFLAQSGDRLQKTIVFCVDTEHAARMRQALINENQDLMRQERRYVMRITGDDKEGAEQLSNFIDPESIYPVLVTTSRLLSTGVDAQTCRLIVLDREVGSMTEFKQIVGRGTRIHEDSRKLYFTVMDFRGATRHFADPAFDGDPEVVYAPKEGEPIHPPDEFDSDLRTPLDDPESTTPFVPYSWGDPEEGRQEKIYVDGVEATIVAERVEYLDADGKLITESLRDFTRKAITRRYASLDAFLTRWNTGERKQAILDELDQDALPLSKLADELGSELDLFDLICHIAFDRPPLTRAERARQARRHDVFSRYGETARQVLNALLDKYEDHGLKDMDNPATLKVQPFSGMGAPLQLVREFGGRRGFEKAVHEIQQALYPDAVA